MQLVRVMRDDRSGWRFEVNEDAVAVLESYGQKPLSVCTVCGPYRTGKSYLLNLLLGRIQRSTQQFRVGSSVNACTEGVWMWGARDETSEAGNMLFLDCEGFGSTDADKTRDAKLMALCILLSSVFLLNTKGVLSEGLFNSLSLVCNLAEHVEESGQEASKPALVWLLRDFVLDLRDESGQDISSDEYLEKSLHAAVPGNHGGRSAGAKEVRDCLLRFFPERKCSTLVMPLVDEDQLRRLSEIPYDTLRPEFRRGFEQVQASIMSMAKARPKTIGGQAVGASGLAALLRRMVEALNSNQMLNMTNAWELVQHNACEALSDELRENALELLRRVREGDPLPGHGGRPLPVRDDVLLEALKEGRKAFRTEWRSRSLGDEAVKEEYWQELKAAIRDQELLLVQLNCKLAEEQLREAGDAWEAWLLQEEEAVAGDPRSEALSLLVDQGMPSRPTARALREALGTCRMARVRWDGEKHAQEVQMKLLRSEVDAQSEAALNASRVEDDAVENTREMAKLKAQVTELTRQMNENMQREKGLREQLCEAEEKLHREVQAQNVEQRRNLELQSQVRDLESQVERLGQDLRDAEDDDRTGGKGKTAGSNPRCGCAVM